MVANSENPLLELPRNMRDLLEEARAEWRFGGTSKFMPRPKGINATGSGADWHWRDENRYWLGVERARFWDRNNLVISQGVDRVCDNVLGEEGPTLNPQTTDPGLNQAIKERFNDWANDPAQADFDKNRDFWQLSWLAYRHSIVDGDVFGLPLQEGQLQLNENHRCRTPYNTRKNVRLGIQFDDLGRRQKYWFTKQDVTTIGTVKQVGQFAQVDPENVFHLMLARRLSQSRGVSKLAPCADAVGMHDDLQFAKMVQAQLVSCFAIIEELSADPANPAPPARGSTKDTDQVGRRTSEARDDGTTEIREAVGPGMWYRGRKGSKLSGFSPGVPNAEFFQHAEMILTFIAINLDLPLAVLLLDPSNTNFSGWRGAVDQSRQTYRRIQKQLAAHWFGPVYHWKLQQFAADDAALRSAMQRLGANFFAHLWQSPGWKYIQPLQDAQADLLALAGGLTSQRRRCAERNMDWGDLSSEIVDDHALLIVKAHQKAQQLNAEHGLNLTWKDLIAIQMPANITINHGSESQATTAAPAGRPA